MNAKYRDIAIVGMSGRFPGSESIAQFWENLCAGKDCISKLSDQSLIESGITAFDINADSYVKVAYLLKDYDHFDPGFFNITPVDAELIDPQIRLFLECAWETLEDAGHATKEAQQIGVFAGMGGVTTNYLSNFINQNRHIEKVTASLSHTGNDKDFIATYVSYKLNLTGPSVSVQTACSTSLVAVHQACMSLLNGECDMALAGGANIRVPQASGYHYQHGNIFSKSGRVRSFDQRADGVVFGNGVGVVLVKPLEQALADGNHIYALVKGSAVANDGSTKLSYVATCVKGQQACIERALHNADVDANSLSFVESHGTGTLMGDPIEISALSKAFSAQMHSTQKISTKKQSVQKQEQNDTEFCALGAVKTSIGHLDVASGITAFIKTALSLKHRTIAPTLHFEQANERITFDTTPFYINTDLRSWDGVSLPRRAGVNSVGVGGTNAFVVLEEYQEDKKLKRQSKGNNKNHKGLSILPFSARNNDSLRDYLCTFKHFLQQSKKPLNLIDVAHTLQNGRATMESRLCFVVPSLESLTLAIEAYLSDQALPLHTQVFFHDDNTLEADNADIPDADILNNVAAQVEQWSDKGLLAEIAKCWTRYGVCHWGVISSGRRFKRVPLPTYHFQRARYWLDAGQIISAQSVSNRIHPLLHDNISDFAQQCYCTSLTGEEFFLNDHQVFKQKILPGVAYIEMARAAIENALPDKTNNGQWQFEHIVWQQPLVVETNKNVFTRLLRQASDEGITFQIYTRDHHNEYLHCQGVAFCKAVEAAKPLVLGRLKAQMHGKGEQAKAIYKSFSTRGIEYGPGHQGLKGFHRGQAQALAKLQLPECLCDDTQHNIQHYVLHPCLLDAAFQASIGVISTLHDLPATPHVPFSVEAVKVLAPCQKHMIAWVRYADQHNPNSVLTTLDIDICDQKGQICVEVRGFAARAFETQDSLPLTEKSIGSSNSLHSMIPVWESLATTKLSQSALNIDENILVIGDAKAVLARLKKSFTRVQHLNIDSLMAHANLNELLASYKADHIIWVAPVDTANVSSDSLLKAQGVGVYALFRCIKALLASEHYSSALVLSILTQNAQSVPGDNTFNPTHAGIWGLAGSLAKEMSSWTIRLLDIDNIDTFAVETCWHLPQDQAAQGLAFRGGQWFTQGLTLAQSLPATQTPYKQRGVYVVIGGAGGLGEVWSRYLIDVFQAQVVWIGRREQDAAIDAKINTLSCNGCTPVYLQADAAVLQSLTQARADIVRRFGQINGVVHSAIVLQDQSLRHMDEARFSSVYRAKCDVSIHMDTVFRDDDLDFMLFFSSVMAFTRSLGQANYAAGCTFKDSFAHFLHHQRPYPVKIVNWGYWGNVGVVTDDFYQQRMAQEGIASIEAEEGLSALNHLVGSELTQLVVYKTLNEQALTALPVIGHYHCNDSDIQNNDGDTQSMLLDAVSRLPPLADNKQLSAIKEGLTPPSLDALAGDILLFTLLSMGLLKEGKTQLASIEGCENTQGFYQQWLQGSIDYLIAAKKITSNYKITGSVKTLEGLWSQWNEQKVHWQEDANVQAQLVLLETCLSALPQILQGQRKATDVMFPGASLALVEGVYKGNALADYYNGVLAKVLAALLEVHQLGADEGGLRILEIGAGTGGTTARLIPLLKAYKNVIAEYCYTDVSKTFLMHAQTHYQPQFSPLCTAILDISRPLSTQDIALGAYDIVIATDVLHATANIRHALRHAKSALKKEGVLLVNELSTWTLFCHLTFGLLEGWWQYVDSPLRIPGTAVLSPESWLQVMQQEGFAPIIFPAQQAHGIGKQIIAAASNGHAWEQVSAQASAAHKQELPQAVKPTRAATRESGETSVVMEGDAHLREMATQYFTQLVADTLKMPAEQLLPHKAFDAFGIDSILVIRLTDRLREDFPEIKTTLFFEVESITGLVDYFIESKHEALTEYLQAEDVLFETQMPLQHRAGTAHDVQLLPGSGLHEDVTATSRKHYDAYDVAVIGISGRYPQSENLEEFWQNLAKGQSCISEIPKERWDWQAYFDAEKGAQGKMYSKWGGFIDDIDKFDPLFFKISPKEAKSMDPQERLFLQTSYHAIEDAGYTPDTLGDKEKIGVYVGVMNARYAPQPYYFSIANRVSFVFDFQGPSMAVDTACSSSLTAIHLGLDSLYSGQSDCVIAGGVNIIIDAQHYLELSALTMLSSGDACKSFGEQADGFVDAEGVGAVILKSLSSAEVNGDHIYAVIKGSAVNAGGKTHGYTVPNPKAQANLVTSALTRAAVTADQLSYIEAHGTGTSLGDPIEIAGLTRAFKQSAQRARRCAIGSIKSNIGHCESAAGIAGLSKIILQLQHRQLVPSLHAERSNPEIAFDETPFVLQTELAHWPEPEKTPQHPERELPRIAGVSSFGAGGANAHLVVAEYIAPSTQAQTVPLAHDRKEVIIPLSARTSQQLQQKVVDLLRWVRANAATLELVDLGYTLQVGREAMDERLVIAVDSVQTLIDLLSRYEYTAPAIDGVLRDSVKRHKATLANFASDAGKQQQLNNAHAQADQQVLMRAWLQGMPVQWTCLYSTPSPKRLALPLYPFARERYWHEQVTPSPVQQVRLHPLLHQNTSDLFEQRFSSTFYGNEPFYSKASEKQSLFPVSALVEMVRAAIEQAWLIEDSAHSIELLDLHFGDPLTIETQTDLHVVLSPYTDTQVQFEIYAQMQQDEHICCQGLAGYSQQPAPATVNLSQLQHCAAEQSLCQPLSLLPSSESDLNQWGVHPLLLQEALHVSAGLVAESQATPLTIARVRFIFPCPAVVYVTTKKNQGTSSVAIDLCDAEGNICVQLIDVAYCADTVQAHNGQGLVLNTPLMRNTERKRVPILCDRPVAQDSIFPTAAKEALLTQANSIQTESSQVQFIQEQSIQTQFAQINTIQTQLFNQDQSSALPLASTKQAAVVLETPEETEFERSSSPLPTVQLSLTQLTVSADSDNNDTNTASTAPCVEMYDCGGGWYVLSLSAAALTQSTVFELLAALDTLEAREDVRVVSIEGGEQVFLKGNRQQINIAIEHGLWSRLAAFAYPLVAVMRGETSGAGMLMAALCDFMLCTQETRYSFSAHKDSIFPTATEEALFSERIGALAARDFLYCSTLLSGFDLRAKGWTCSVVPATQLEKTTLALIEQLKEKPQKALRLLKTHLAQTRLEQSRTLQVVDIAPWQNQKANNDKATDAITITTTTATTTTATQLPNCNTLSLSIENTHTLVVSFNTLNDDADVYLQCTEFSQLMDYLHKATFITCVLLRAESPLWWCSLQADSAQNIQPDILSCPVPVIAMLTGDAHTWGLYLALCCDVCLYHESGHYYIEKELLSSPLGAQAAWVLDSRLGPRVGRALLLSQQGKKGDELASETPNVTVLNTDDMFNEAFRLADQWAQWPREQLCTWKMHTAERWLTEINALPEWAKIEEHFESGWTNIENYFEPNGINSEECYEPDEVNAESQNKSALIIEEDYLDTVSPGKIALTSTVIHADVDEHGVVVVRMEDRDAKNMFSDAFIAGFKEVFAHIATAPNYKVVVLTGFDNYFASGGTKESLLAIQQGKIQFTDHSIYHYAMSCPLPVIAAVQGHGLGAGWTLGMFADAIFLHDASHYVSPYMQYGFTPGAGATFIYPHVIGQELANETLFTAQEFTGRELYEKGIPLAVLPRDRVLTTALALAQDYAKYPRHLLLLLKRQWSQGMQKNVDLAYQAELAMHDETFVGQQQAASQIERQFLKNSNAATQKVTDILTDFPEAAEQEGIHESLHDVVRTLKVLLAQELHMDVADVDEDTQFVDLGMDSIIGVTWVRNINNTYNIQIEAVTIYSYPTLSELAGFVKDAVAKVGSPQRRIRTVDTLASMKNTTISDTTDRAAATNIASINGVADRTVSTNIASINGVADRAAQTNDASVNAVADRTAQTNDVSINNVSVVQRPVLRSLRQLKSLRLRSGFSSTTVSSTAPIAVIGMAGQFPQAENIDQFWENVAAGKNCVMQVPDERWSLQAYFHEGEPVAGKTYSKWMGALTNYDCFDPLFFNISPQEAETMDPQQRLFMQTCWHGIEHGGYNPMTLSGSKCGVFVGCDRGDYHQTSSEQLSAQGFTGAATSILAARIAYFLNLQGPCLSIETACSSSLVAIATACDSLNTRSCDLALAGGVCVMAGPSIHIKTAQAGMLSADGKCFAFDQRANGFVPGEAVAVVLLKRLADAEQDDDLICGVIDGWGINQDGKSNGITAPNAEAQTRLQVDVYKTFNIDPANISLVEAHGTGTKLGDPIEISGLKSAFTQFTDAQQYCALGSVKSNIGHCATAAGVCGFIKLLLAFQHRQLPPTIHFDQLNEHIKLSNSAFFVNTQLTDWIVAPGQKRQAAISSFGFSGTNAHIVLSEYQPVTSHHSLPSQVLTQDGHYLVPISAKTPDQLQQSVHNLLIFLEKQTTTVSLASLAYTLQIAREATEERVGFFVDSVATLQQKLKGFMSAQKDLSGVYRGDVRSNHETMTIFNHDEDTANLVDQWLVRGKLNKVLELWVKGFIFDWQKLYVDGKPKRMRLPCFPFAKERYWHAQESTIVALMSAGNRVQHKHPLLHSNVSDFTQQAYRSHFNGQEFFLADHRVELDSGQVYSVLPGVSYLEMARVALTDALAHEYPQAPLQLTDVVWLSPVVVDKAITLETIVTEDEDMFSFEIMNDENDTSHCQGQASFIAHSTTQSLDLAHCLQLSNRGQINSDAVYQNCSAMGLHYGAAHRGIQRIYLGEHAVLAALHLPAIIKESATDYDLHPALMDSALQASIALIQQKYPDLSRPAVPFALEKMTLYGATKHEMFAWIRFASTDGGRGQGATEKLIKMDIDVCDLDGNILVELRGFSTRLIQNSCGDELPSATPKYQTL